MNHQIKKQIDGKNAYYIYAFDERGNMVEGEYHQNQNHSYPVEKYVYDATNRMVKGSKYIGRSVDFEDVHNC